MRAIKDNEQEAKNQSFIGDEFARANERQKAIADAEQALKLIQAPNINKFIATIVRTNVGRTYSRLGESEKAVTFYEEPLRLWQSSGSKRNEAITLKHIATALRDLGRLEEAKVNIEKSIALQYLPFAALPAPAMPGTETKTDPRPLILDHEIVSLPSASVVAALRREIADRKPAAKAVAVLADPVFEMDDARVKLRLTSRTNSGGTQNQPTVAASTLTLKRR